jgi:hypothetical protein
MKRVVFLFLAVCLMAGCAAFAQTTARRDGSKTDDHKACPFSIVGLWRAEGMTEMTQILFDFSPEGHITMMGYSPNTLPQDFEMMGAVNYKLDKKTAPKRLEFITTRGNETFLPGITILDILEYSDTSFTTREPATGQQMRWVREQTRRYFLTFAARSGPLPHGGPAFAMWTVIDGRDTKIEALGIQVSKVEQDKTAPVFGTIPAELYQEIREESEKEKKPGKEETVIVRFELTQAEFETTYKIYQTWDKYVHDRALPYSDPYQNGMEFLKRAAEGLNRCGEKAQLYRPTEREQEEVFSKYDPPRRMLEYIRMLRKKNEELHIDDVEFPWQWRPMIQAPGQ